MTEKRQLPSDVELKPTLPQCYTVYRRGVRLGEVKRRHGGTWSYHGIDAQGRAIGKSWNPTRIDAVLGLVGDFDRRISSGPRDVSDAEARQAIKELAARGRSHRQIGQFFGKPEGWVKNIVES